MAVTQTTAGKNQQILLNGNGNGHVTNGKSNGGYVQPQSVKVEHNLAKGIWQLCRLHTVEGLSTASIGWVALFFYAVQQNLSFDSQVQKAFFGILASFQITHGVFCMWNDICDRDFDGKVARTKQRPLPSGMVTYPEAMVAFIVGFGLAIGATYAILGLDVTLAMGPAWVLSFIYPLCKRVIWAPQVVLGLTMATCVFPPWVALGGELAELPFAGKFFGGALVTGGQFEVAGGVRLLNLPGNLFGAIFSWLVYIDLIYASQDRVDDTGAGVKSLAVFLGDHLKSGLTFLGALQTFFFLSAAYEATASTFLWTAGVAVWVLSIPFSIIRLDPADRESGGRIFLVNAFLVLYMAGVAGLDVFLTAKQ
ncbi:UbiA-like polyprenyl transferase AtnF [Rhypophila decipiens]|uniref:UbiA-like polyprenyl transferase AtnF n=1 Tax=Rhypophila decipiens TaxID=261697 RepID=A0AAN7B4Z7_9PEZI|nr:UbiA-like polyprenyl transferase AtnF [Rhypophila decipiens]